MADHSKKPPAGTEKKANRRGAARLAAVQALYQMDIAGAGINDIFAEFESHWLGNEVEGDTYLPAEAAFFRDVVSGVVRDQKKLDPLIDEALSKGWPLKRIEAILRAVLRAGPTSSSTARTCRAASSCPNMSTSPTPSSTARRPAWSTPCSTRSAASFAATSSGGGRLSARAVKRCDAAAPYSRCHHPRRRVIQYAACLSIVTRPSLEYWIARFQARRCRR